MNLIYMNLPAVAMAALAALLIYTGHGPWEWGWFMGLAFIMTHYISSEK